MPCDPTPTPRTRASPNPVRFLSLFSGIEAASLAWLPLGWECMAVAEIEPFPCAVLKHHYPDVPNLGNVTGITEDQIKQLGRIDVVVGGFPCQDLSVAGKRKGLTHADGTRTRSGLFFTGLQLFRWAEQHCGARFLLVENVPGLFSSNQGRDFAAVVGHMAGLDGVRVPAHGWGAEGVAAGDHGLLEWATVDAQWFHLAQRRRRVFALLDTGDWASRPPVLLEPEGLRGDSPPRRQAWEGVAAGSGRRAAGGRGAGHPLDGGVSAGSTSGAGFWRDGIGALRGRAQDSHENLVAYGVNKTSGSVDVATALNAHGGPCVRLDFESETFVAGTAPCLRAGNPFNNSDPGMEAQMLVTHALRGEGFDASEDGTGRGTPLVPCGQPYTLATRGRAGTHSLEYRQDGTANAILTPNGGRAGIGVGAVAYRVHGEHSTAMTGGGVANVADPAEVARCLDTCGGYSSNQGGNVVAQAIAFPAYLSGTQRASAEDVCPALCSANPTAIAFSCKDHGGDAGETAPTLRAMGHHRSHANAGGQLAVAFQQNTRDEVRLIGGDGRIVGALAAEPGMKQQNFLAFQTRGSNVDVGEVAGTFGSNADRASGSGPMVQRGMAVRRLTPRECERLQGFPDDYTLVPYRGKPTGQCADGPRYKSLGNSMAVPCMAWIGRRIDDAINIDPELAA